MEKWSFSKIEATRGCKIAFEKRYIQELPADTEVPEYTDAKNVHEEIQTNFIKKKVNYLTLDNTNVAVEKAYRHYFEEQDIDFIAYADIVLETDSIRTILDIKCRYNPSINERDKLQLMTYTALASKEKPFAQNKIGIIVPYNQYEPISIIDIEPPPIEFVLTEIEKAKRRIPRMTVRTDECVYCEYKKSCDYGMKTINDRDFQAVAEKYLYLKAQVDMYEDILRKHTELTNEKIRVGDKEIGFFERVYTKIDAPEFIMLCQGNDIPYIDTVKIDTVKAKQLAKKHEVLTQAFDKEIKYVFTTKKVEDTNG